MKRLALISDRVREIVAYVEEAESVIELLPDISRTKEGNA